MKQRSRNILNELMVTPKLGLEQLANWHGVSERTIRNDVTSLNEYLSNESLGSVNILKKEIFLKLTVDNNELRQHLDDSDFYTYKLNTTERSLICLLMMLKSHDYVTIQYLSSKMLISRTTVVNDIKNMKKLASAYDIKVISKANKGYKVEADEIKIRFFLEEILRDNNLEIFESIIFEENYKQLIDYQKLEEIISYCRSTLKLSEVDMAKLTRWLTIAAYRNKQHFYIESVQSTCNYSFELLRRQLKNYPYLTERDFYCVCELFNSPETSHNSNSKIDTDAIRIQVIAMQFIEKVSQELKIDFKDDYIFYENFSGHLMRMLKSQPHSDQKRFSMDDVIKSNRKIQHVVMNYLYIIEENINRRASDLETDYIIIHVYAAMERKKRKGANLKVALLTDEKQTNLFLLESKLVRNFSFQLDTYSIEDRIDCDYDLVLTTVPKVNDSYIKISSYISDEDYILIAKQIDEVVTAKEFQRFTLNREVVAKILEVVNTEIDKDFTNKAELKANIRESLFQHVEPGRVMSGENYLSDFLTANRIELDVSIDNWQEAVRYLGNKMLRKKEIASEYIDIVIDNIEDNGPYVVISKGFAFPHAEIGSYNHGTAMELIRLKEPIYFDDQYHDLEDDIGTQHVSYICLLSATDQEKHLKAFFNLSNLLKSQRVRERFDNAQSAEELAQFIAEEEELLELRR